MNYHNLTYPDMNNGEGLRVVLWLSGCSHHCYNCQNPQTWDENSGIPFDESAKEELFRELDKDYISGLTLTGGDPLYESSLDDVLDLVTEVNKRYNTPQYIEGSNGDNHNISNDNADEIRLSSPKKSIWIYSGYQFEDIFQEYYMGEYVGYPYYDKSYPDRNTRKRQTIIRQCDVLIDGRYIDSQRDITLKWCGSTNQRVINIKQSLELRKIILWKT
ncbi:MAG: 4Fe-4S cluster-binding domain-containing protein [Clostridium sp.]|nr:4Fe-4S cluster-binding domain-containing protein [Clostridium sp.]